MCSRGIAYHEDASDFPPLTQPKVVHTQAQNTELHPLQVSFMCVRTVFYVYKFSLKQDRAKEEKRW